MILIILFLASVFANIEIGPNITSIKNYNNVIETMKNYDRYNLREKVILESINKIPNDASVSATYLIVPHMTHRKIIYMFPNPFKEAYWGAMTGNFTPPTPTKDVEYIIADMQTVNLKDKEEFFDRFVNDRKYSKIFEKYEIVVLKRN